MAWRELRFATPTEAAELPPEADRYSALKKTDIIREDMGSYGKIREMTGNDGRDLELGKIC